MYDLVAFRQRIQELYRRSSPYSGRRPNQQDLADAVGLNRSELSSRLNGLKNAKLTNRDVHAIVKTLTEWGAITTRAEAVELLELVDCPNFSPAEWQAPPLVDLEVTTLPSTNERPKSNLPRSITNFVGRKQEIGDVVAQVQQHRLVTISGVGGSGKTRLALEAAQQVAGRFADGVFLVELANLNDATEIPSAIAAILAVAEQPTQPLIATLRRFLYSKHLLLVLDNCEHLTAAVAALAADLLAACPHLSLLATSRESIGVSSETIYPLQPLSLPQGKSMGVEALGKADAVQLLLDRVRSIRPGFQLTSDNAVAVREICQQLDGLPLAIELAAARLQMLSPAQLAANLNERFRLLTDRRHGVAPRHQTLRSLIDWSYDLLPAAAQQLLRYLAVFHGGFTLDSAAGVMGVSSLDLLDTLTELLNKSLIQNALVAGDEATMGLDDGLDVGPPRFTMLQTIGDYALLRLRESNEEQAAQQAHALWYRQLASNADVELRQGDQAAWRLRLEQEYYNLQTAITWSLSEEPQSPTALHIVALLWRFWPSSGRVSEARRWLDAALARADNADVAMRARALESAGRLAHMQAAESDAGRYFNAALELYRTMQDESGIASTLNNLGAVALRLDDYDNARRYYESSLTIQRRLGDKLSVSIGLANLGMIAETLGDYTNARQLYVQALALRRALGNKAAIASLLVNLGDLTAATGESRNAQAFYQEALDIFRELNDHWNVAHTLTSLGNAEVLLDNHVQAEKLYRQAITMHRDMENWLGLGLAIAGVVRLAIARGELHRAAVLLGAAQQTMQSVNIQFSGLEATAYERNRATVIAALGEDEFAAAYAEGQGLDIPSAVIYALSRAGAKLKP